MIGYRHIPAGLVLFLALPLLMLGCSEDPTEPTPVTTATITAPAQGDEVSGLEMVVMEGFGTMTSGQPIFPNNMYWYLDEAIEDSLIGTGFSQSRYLPPGDRKLILVAHESINLSATTSVDIHVQTPDNYPPVPRIIEPFDGEDYLPAHVVTILHGAGRDVEDGDLGDAALSWRSNIDGDLGTGSIFEARLSPGDHSLILTATDSGGATASDTIQVTMRHRPAAPVVDGEFYFEANEFNLLCADKEFVWLIGDCFVDVNEDLGTADLTIYDMSGTLTCDIADLCLLGGELVNGNVRVTTTVDDGAGGTLQMEISLAVTDAVELTGLVRGLEIPAAGEPCIYRSEIRMALKTD